MSVCAIIVTRGDQDLTAVAASIPDDWELLIWNNAVEKDYGVFGRYAAIERTKAELIYVQDDDCIVEDPAFIVDTFMSAPADSVICNMPQEFRHSFYEEHALVGFGAAFHWEAPALAFKRFREAWPVSSDEGLFNDTCDIVFTALTPRVLVDVPHIDLYYAHHEERMWKQPGHQAERVRMLDLVRQLA